MVSRLKNPICRLLMQSLLLSTRGVHKPLKTNDGVCQHRKYQSFLRFEERLAFPGLAIVVHRQFVRLEKHGQIAIIISDLVIVHVFYTTLRFGKFCWEHDESDGGSARMRLCACKF